MGHISMMGTFGPSLQIPGLVMLRAPKRVRAMHCKNLLKNFLLPTMVLKATFSLDDLISAC